MANQMIALGVRAPQAVDFGGAATRYSNMMTQRAQMEAFKQDAASKQMEREQKRALSAAYASSINPQTGEVDQSALIRNMQASGLGSAIPGAMEELAKTRDAGAKAKTSDLAYYKSFNDTAIEELTSALSPEQAIAAGARLKARFPDLGANIDELVQTIPQDPKLYEPWRQKQLFQSMQADKQIEYTMTKAKDENMLGPNGEILTVRTGSERPVEGVVQQPMLTPRGGTGGPYEAAPAAAPAPTMGSPAGRMPGARSPRVSADLANPLMNVRNDAEYQLALQMMDRKNPQAAAAVRQLMPRFDPARLEGIRNAAAAEFEVLQGPQSRRAGNPPMVAGPRGGPDEGMPMRASSTQDGMVSNFGQPEYVSTGRPAYARVPAPPQGPQPRETAAEVEAKEEARLRAKRKFDLMPQPPKPLTAAQEAKLRDNLTKDYKAAKTGIAEMTDPKTGLIAAVDAMRNLTRSQKEGLTGYSNYLPSIWEGAKTADTRWGNLVGKITQMGKSLASLGGAIGPMAVQEWSIVRQMVAETDPVKMGPDDLDNQLELIRATAIGAAERIKDAYENQYVEEFARYPGRFQLNTPSAPAKKAAPPKGGWGKATVVGN